MTLIRFLLKESDISLVRLGGLAALTGLMNAVILALINMAAANAAADQASNFRTLLLYALAIAIYTVAQKALLITSATVVETSLHTIRQRIANKIRQAELLAFEGIGRARLYASVGTEVQTVSQATPPLVIGAQSAFLVGFSLLYLAWLSVTALVLMLVVIAIAVSIHFQRLRETSALLREAFEHENRFFDALTHVLDGFKEAKMHAARSHDLHHQVRTASAAVAELKIKVGTQFAGHFIFSQTAFYILVASIVFLLPRLSETYSEVVTRATATVLFIFGPLTSLIGAVPVLEQANVAIDRIYDLERELDVSVGAPAAAAAVHPAAPALSTFGRITLEHVVFHYTNPLGVSMFQVGPLELTLTAGETLFIVGGNGSGKSTLLKLLTALYYPHSGQITLDGRPLAQTGYLQYRSLFSVIFSDYHLFDRPYGLADVDPARVEELLEMLELQDKTRFVEGRFVNQDLSGGQKKRLALLVTLLEDRPIHVFDEWAADQDPLFRQYFYEHILPDLTQQGKTIIAATHDDRYFHVADRLLKMEDGHFVAG